MDIIGKNIILTGASSGIGLALLKQLSIIDNVRIIAVARNIKIIPILDNIIFPFAADLTKPEEIDDLFEYAKAKLGRVDIFIANAGFAYMELLNKADWKHNEKIFALNTLSPIYSLQKLIDQNSLNEKYFVCTNSAVSTVPLPYYSLYCASKAAISSFLKTYEYESPPNLKIACVYPIATRTPFFEKAEKNSQPTIPFMVQDADTVAKSIIKGIKKNKKNIYPSTLFRVFEYIGKLFPFVFKIYSKREKQKIDKAKIL